MLCCSGRLHQLVPKERPETADREERKEARERVSDLSRGEPMSMCV